MGLDLDKGREILKKYCNPNFAKVKDKKLVLALVEVGGCPHTHGLNSWNKKCNRECYECWSRSLHK